MKIWIVVADGTRLPSKRDPRWAQNGVIKVFDNKESASCYMDELHKDGTPFAYIEDVVYSEYGEIE